MIDSFRGEYAFLSNMYECIVKWKDLEFGSAEALYQARKFEDENRIKQFTTLDGKTAKKYAKSLKDEWRKDWHIIKESAMFDTLYAKYSRNLDLQEKLLATEDHELVEGNWWGDTFWGVCNGNGQNKLGKQLMQLRSFFRVTE